MFLGVLNPTPEVADRLQAWADTLWPGHRAVGDDVGRLWVSADIGVLSEHLHESAEHRLAIDGWIWNADGDGPMAVEWGALDRLGDALIADRGWPLSRAWDGSFACAAFDKASGGLSLAVDPIGLRRLFYARSGETIVFGNVQSACAFALGLEPDLGRLAQWLGTGNILGRGTLFRGLREILIGERRRFRRDGSELDAAIDVPWHQARTTLSSGQAADALVPLLREHARRFAERLRPGRAALALSGGMDSRLVLGALGERARDLLAYTYGAADDREVAIAVRCARAMGAVPKVVDLTGRYFPAEEPIRRRALLSEAISFTHWHHVDEAAERDGVETLLFGDITNCMNVYIKPLRGRKERVRRAVDRLLLRQRAMDENPTSPEAWLDGEIRGASRAAVGMAERLGLDVDAGEVAQSVADGYRELHEHLTQDDQSLYCLQEAFYLAIERQASGGSQIVSISGRREVIPIFSTRRIVEQGFNTPFESRTRRGVLDAVARRILPPAIRRIPTATIPWVSVSAPKWSQEAAWVLRWLADAGCRRLTRRLPPRWRRDRLFATIAMQPEYVQAVALGWAEPWAISGVAPSEYWTRRIARTATGDRPTTVPISEMRALMADTMIAASIHGPDVVDRLAELPRT